MMSLNPAKIIKMDDVIGSIEIGKNADFTILDKELQEEYTYHIVSDNKKEENDLFSNSPLGQALFNNKVGDIVTVKAEEEYQVEVIDIDNSKVPSVVAKMQAMQNEKSATPNKLVRNLNKGYDTYPQF